MELNLNVYDEQGEVKKTCKAETVELEFGTIRALMKVLNVEQLNDTGELLGTLFGAWEQVVNVLAKCFP